MGPKKNTGKPARSKASVTEKPAVKKRQARKDASSEKTVKNGRSKTPRSAKSDNSEKPEDAGSTGKIKKPKTLLDTLTAKKRKTRETEPESEPKPAKRPYKKRATKPSLILSLQSSPVITEGRKGRKSTKDTPLITSIPKLEPGAGRSPKLVIPSKNGSAAFTEPELAPPQPGYSGHPLESLPPLKLKRAAAAGRGSRKTKALLSRTSIEPPSEAEIEEKEGRYKMALQTKKSEKLTGNSELRASAHTVSRRGRKNTRHVSRARASTPDSGSESTGTTTIDVPPTPASRRRAAASPGSLSVKRIKIISPKKSNAVLARPVSVPSPETSDSNDNDDYCSTCGGTGIFICCDTCPSSFHLLCCDPPLRDVPEENWNCRQCTVKLGLGPKPFNDLGMFGPLLNTTIGRNPTEFKLPKGLRERTFIGVSTGDDCAYQDSSVNPELSAAKMNGGQISGYNRDDDLDIDALYDESGDPYLCHKCGLSGLKKRTMTTCDYCPLTWHLDCLPYPMCSAKTKGQKWRCPNHVEVVLPSFWMERRSFKDALVVDSAAHNNFLQFQHATNFLVKYSDQPYLAENSPVSQLQAYQQYQARSFITSDTEEIDHKIAENEVHPDSEDETESGEHVTPDYLSNFAIGGRVAAKASEKVSKVLLMTNADDPDQKPFIYRVPEHQVVLDFLSSAKSRKEEILQEIGEYEGRATAEKGRDLDAVNALLLISSKQASGDASVDATKLPVQNGAKLDQTHSPEQGDTTHSKTSFSGSGRNEGSDISDFSASEAAELRHIRRAIQAKGKDALMRFLAS